MNDSEFIDLCTRVLDGTVAAEDVRRWNDRLATDPRLRGLYRDFCGQQVCLEEELTGAPQAGATQPQPVRGVATVGRLAIAAAVLVTASVWWRNGGEADDGDRADRPIATALAEAPADGAPSAFMYPFEAFPNLQSESIEADPNRELRLVELDEIDPRIVTIAQQLAGFEFTGEPKL